MFVGNVIDLVIPSDPEGVALLLMSHARDWGEVLHFLDSVSKSRGMILDVAEISRIVKESYGDEYGQ